MPGEVTVLLHRLRDGEADAESELFTALYPELKALAGHIFRSQRANHTLEPTALVHEAYLKMIKPGAATPQDRAHFCAVAAKAMRQILVNHARDKNAQKRGGKEPGRRVTLAELMNFDLAGNLDVLAVHEALEELAKLDERQARLAELRFFAGLTNSESAEVLGVSLRSVELDWQMAKAWLAERLG